MTCFPNADGGGHRAAGWGTPPAWPAAAKRSGSRDGNLPTSGAPGDFLRRHSILRVGVVILKNMASRFIIALLTIAALLAVMNNNLFYTWDVVP